MSKIDFANNKKGNFIFKNIYFRDILNKLLL